MKEGARRQKLIELLEPLHAVAVENSLNGAGTPDVNCTAGWIEVKQLDGWPVRGSTVVQPRHFRDEQRYWLRNRCDAGGRAWLLLCVENEWCLVWGATAAKHVGVDWCEGDYKLPTVRHVVDRVYWPRTPDSRDLIHTLLIRHWR